MAQNTNRMALDVAVHHRKLHMHKTWYYNIPLAFEDEATVLFNDRESCFGRHATILFIYVTATRMIGVARSDDQFILLVSVC